MGKKFQNFAESIHTRAAAVFAEKRKIAGLNDNYIVKNIDEVYVPVAMEVTGAMGPRLVALIEDMGSTIVDSQATLPPPDAHGVHKEVFLSGQPKALRIKRFTERLAAVPLRGQGIALDILRKSVLNAAKMLPPSDPGKSSSSTV